jgi:hypothetical protein
MFSDVDSIGHVSLLKFTTTRAAFAPLGPGATPFPNFSARMQPSDSLTSIGASSGLPLLGAYLGANAVLCPSGSRARVRGDAAVGEWSPGPRRTGFPSRRHEGLPGFWSVLLLRAVVEHPAGYAPCSPYFTHVAPSPSR